MAHNESEFTRKLKKLFSNRSVVVTIVTLLVATGIILAVTISANRAPRPSTGGNRGTETDTQATINDETLPTGNNGNGGETLPTGNNGNNGNNGGGGETLPTGNNGNNGNGGETLPTGNNGNNGGETLPTVNDKETLPVVDEPEADKYTLPVTGKLMKAHDPTIQVYSNTMGDYRVHLGLDITTQAEAPVYAIADGTVEKIWNDALMGTCLAISHAEDVVSIYKNLAPEMVSGIAVGATVTQGQEIAKVGESAVVEMADEPHLHYEMTVNGISVDPLKYFSDASVETLSKDTAFENAGMTPGK